MFFSKIRGILGFQSGQYSWMMLIFLLLTPLIIWMYHHHERGQIEESFMRVNSMQERLQNISAYDLKALRTPNDRVVQLTRLSTVDQAPLKFVTETGVEDREIRETSFVMQQAAVVDGRTVLRILEIVQPAMQETSSGDLWVKQFKMRKEKSGYLIQMALVKREMKR